jgi:opacity protein-like surface antigen
VGWRGLLVVSLVAILSPAFAVAQDPPLPEAPAPDTIPDAVPDTIPDAPAPIWTPPRFTVSVSIGTLGSGDLQTQAVQAERLGEDGVVLESADLGRRIGLRGGYRAQVSATGALGHGWALRLAAAMGRGRLAHSYSGPDRWAADAAALPAAGDRDVSLTGIETALRFNVLTGHRLSPYLEVGIAADRWQSAGAGDPVAGAAALSAGVTRVAGLAAVGGLYPVTDRLAVRVQATTRFQRTPLSAIPPGHEIARGDTLVLTTQAHQARPFADPAVELLSLVRLDFGLSYGLGPAGAMPRVRSESDE